MYARSRYMRDTCLDIIEKLEFPDHFEIKGAWVNISGGEPFHIVKRDQLAIEILTIPKDKYEKEWEEQEQCFSRRYKKRKKK